MQIILHIEIAEIEFPDIAAISAEIGEVTFGIGECESDLDYIESINIGFEESVQFCGSLSVRGFAFDSEDDSRELGVHGDEWELIYEFRDEFELRFKCGLPD